MEPSSAAAASTESLPNNGIVEEVVAAKPDAATAAAATTGILQRRGRRRRHYRGGGCQEGPRPAREGHAKVSPEKKFAAAAAALAADADADADSLEQEPVWRDVIAERYEFEYQIKWKGRSHRHLEWVSAEEIEANSARAKQMFHRYLNKLRQSVDDGHDEADTYDEVWECRRILSTACRRRRSSTETSARMKRKNGRSRRKQAVENGGAERRRRRRRERRRANGRSRRWTPTTAASRRRRVGRASRSEEPLFSVGQNVEVLAHERKGKMHGAASVRS